jgi:hypothetical protein
MELENINPSVFKKSDERAVIDSELDENVVDPIDTREVFGEIEKVRINQNQISKFLSSQI